MAVFGHKRNPWWWLLPLGVGLVAVLFVLLCCYGYGLGHLLERLGVNP